MTLKTGSLTRRMFGQSASALLAAGTMGLSGRVLAASPAQLIVGYGAIGANRHPHYLTNVPDCDIVNTMFDPLVTRLADGSIVPVLATKYETLSPTKMRFHLRNDVKFHDGQPLKAIDVKFSLENYASTPNKYMYSDWLDHAEVVDDHTVDLIAKTPSRVALSNMAYMSHIIPHTATDPAAFAAKPVGSGAYRFSEAIPNDRLTVTRNEDYWGNKAPFGRIVFRNISETATRMSAMAAKEIDFAAAVPVDDMPWLTKSGAIVDNTLSARTMFLRFNFLADSPLKDVRVRRALNHAVDREAIREAILQNMGASAIGPVPASVAFANKGLAPYDYNPEKAKKLLAEAGYPNGFSMPLVTPNGRYTKDREIAEAVGGQLEQIGVRCQILPMEWATLIQQVSTERTTTGKKYPVHLFAWGNLTGDVDFSLQAFDENNFWNLGSYRNPEVQALINQGRLELDKAKATQIYDQAQKLIWEDAPFLFLFVLPALNAMQPNVKGFRGRDDEQITWTLVSAA